jgi:hypothetical protein
VGIISLPYHMSCIPRIPLDSVNVLSKRTMVSVFKVGDFKDVPQVGFPAGLY